MLTPSVDGAIRLTLGQRHRLPGRPNVASAGTPSSLFHSGVGNTVSLRLIRRASESPWSGPELEAALTVAWWMAKARSDLWGPYTPGPQLEYFSRTRRVVRSICAATARDDHPTRRIGCITTKAARPRRTTRPGEARRADEIGPQQRSHRNAALGQSPIGEPHNNTLRARDVAITARTRGPAIGRPPALPTEDQHSIRASPE